MGKTKFVSIIITNFSSNKERSEMFLLSLDSLFKNTNYPYELIVVDNGGNNNLSVKLLEFTKIGKINTYIRNSNNMHFGYARNQGLSMAHGEYICIADNDIYYKPGWLEACVSPLEEFWNHSIYTTPIDYPLPARSRYDKGVLKSTGIFKEYGLSTRAGSNLFVIRKKDMDNIGNFKIHRIAGSHWTDEAVNKGYLACVVPGEYAVDMGLRRGYDMKDPKGVNIELSNGQDIYFNVDEFRIKNPEKEFYEPI